LGDADEAWTSLTTAHPLLARRTPIETAATDLGARLVERIPHNIEYGLPVRSGMLVWRLGTAAYPIWDGTGAAMFGGRWNPAGLPAIYAAGHISLAMLERLVQRSNLTRMPIVDAFVPDDLASADLMNDPPPNWRALDSPEAVAAGGAWLAERRTAVLRVPSAIVPREANYAIDPVHPDAARIVVGATEPLVWDPRLFGVPPPG
jgi:RES domain-containing protein